MKFFITLFILLLLTACQSTLIKTNDSYFETASHSSIEITQSLDVSPNSARAFLQNGEVIPQVKLDLYNVNCEVEINTVSETRQTILPGKFNIHSISQDESPIVITPEMKKPVMVASLQYAWGGDSDSPVDIKRYYQFRLSAQEPESMNSKVKVRSLICRGVQDEPYKAELPTLEEMQAAVGSYIIFNLI